MYNALSGNGDENLLLTLGLSMPLAAVGLLALAYRLFFLPRAVAYRFEEVVLTAAALAWIGVLMSRPHKVPYSLTILAKKNAPKFKCCL